MAETNVDTQIQLIAKDVSFLKTEFVELKNEIRGGYITKYQFESLERRTTAMEEGNKWLIRTIAGTIIGVIITAVLALGP